MRYALFTLLAFFYFSSPLFAQISPEASTDVGEVHFAKKSIGFLKIPDIEGESKYRDHEGEIEIYGVDWSAFQPTRSAAGAGRARSRSIVLPVTISKYIDKATPYLMLAQLQGKSFEEIVLTLRKDSGDAHLDYLTITMTNVVISSFNQKITDSPQENYSFRFEKIKVKYIEQNDDHSSGDEHEIEYDIAAGV